ncbi:MAG: PDZ domain-containing protein [Spirochaetia bacterium]
MRRHFSTAARIALIGALALAIGTAAGFAQTKTDTPSQPGPTQRPALVADPGVLVLGVQAGSPAEKAGIVRGDVILEAKGSAVSSLGDLARAVQSMKSGDSLELKVRHGDAQKSMSLVLGSQAGRTWMGVLLYPGEEREGRPFGELRSGALPFPPGGAFVESVVAGSPAEKAGLKKGDVILSVDGTAFEPQQGLSEKIAAMKVGDTVTLSVQSPPRSGEKGPRDVKVQLGKNPSGDGPYLGIQYSMAPLMGDRMMPGPGVTAGVFVADVASDSPAAKAGIAARDLITRVEGAGVQDPQQVIDAVAKHKPGESLALSVQHWGETKETAVTVTLGASPKDAGKAYIGVSMRRLPGSPEDRDREGPRMRPALPGQNPPTL